MWKTVKGIYAQIAALFMGLMVAGIAAAQDATPGAQAVSKITETQAEIILVLLALLTLSLAAWGVWKIIGFFRR